MGGTPSIEMVQKYVSQHINARVLGIVKQSDNEYLVITNLNANQYGGPYQIYRLMSGEWIVNRPGEMYAQFDVITNTPSGRSTLTQEEARPAAPH